MSGAIPWYSWSTEAFARAHSTRRPVLLVLVVSWSAACRALEHEVLADPRVARLVRDRVVPVRVDAERRPDLAERYGAGGWPTILLLTADGDPLCGGSFVDADRLAATIADAADRCARDPDGIRALAIAARRARQAQHDATIPQAGADDDPDHALAWIAARILQDYDQEHGGFGTHEKFPLIAPVAFALHHGQRTADADLLDVAQTTLDRMGWGGLSSQADEADEANEGVVAAGVVSVGGPDEAANADAGAFHRMCARRDWSEPDRVHLLDVQADLARLYLDAWTITRLDRYRDRARDVLAYVDRALHDRADGGFFASAAVMTAAVAATAAPVATSATPVPASAAASSSLVHASPVETLVDRVLLTDANAKMIRALVLASQVLDEPAYAERAARAAERLLPAVFSRGAGVAHLLDTHARVRGLLTDQIHASAAAFDLALVTGDRTYLDLSDELLRSSLRKLWDATHYAFVDRLRSSAGAGDVGLLAEPLRPFALNCEAARLLQRVGQETGHAEFTSRAADLRRWLAATYQTQGLMAADYGLVLLDDPTGDPARDPAA